MTPPRKFDAEQFRQYRVVFGPPFLDDNEVMTDNAIMARPDHSWIKDGPPADMSHVVIETRVCSPWEPVER